MDIVEIVGIVWHLKFKCTLLVSVEGGDVPRISLFSLYYLLASSNAW